MASNDDDAAIVIGLILGALFGVVTGFFIFHGDGSTPAPVTKLPAPCASIEAPLRLAITRLEQPTTANAGRDIAVTIAPWVAVCVAVDAPALRAALEGLAVSRDAEADRRVVWRVVEAVRAVEDPR